MNEKPSYFAAAARYGLFVGLMLILFSIVTRALGAGYGSNVQYISYILIIAGIVLATIFFRDKELEGYISYSGALGFGTLVTSFAGIIAAIYTYLLMTYIDPDIMNEMLLQTEEKLTEQGLTDEQIEQGMQMSKMFTNPALLSVISLFTYALMGFIFSLITAAFLKKENTSEAA